MQVNMIFGFLGSGKTTLVRHLLGARARVRPADRTFRLSACDKRGREVLEFLVRRWNRLTRIWEIQAALGRRRPWVVGGGRGGRFVGARPRLDIGF